MKINLTQNNLTTVKEYLQINAIDHYPVKSTALLQASVEGSRFCWKDPRVISGRAQQARLFPNNWVRLKQDPDGTVYVWRFAVSDKGIMYRYCLGQIAPRGIVVMATGPHYTEFDYHRVIIKSENPRTGLGYPEFTVLDLED
jgi:hypothetical protein